MKKIFKRSMALMLILVMTLSLCACGSSGSGSGSTANSGSETADPGYTYVSSYKPINNEDNKYLYSTYCDDTGFLCSVNEVVGKDIPEGKTEEYEGQYDVYENRFYRIDFDGNMSRLEGFKPIEVESEHHGTSYVQNICSDGNGGFVTYENYYASWNDAPEGMDENDEDYWSYYKYEEGYYVRHLAADGSELSCVKLGGSASEDGNNSYFYVYDMATDKDGHIYLACDSAGVNVYDTDGSVLFNVPTDKWVDKLTTLPDGRVAAVQWADNGGCELQVVDFASHTFSDKYTLTGNAYNLQTGGGDYDLYYSTGLSFYGYDLENAKEERLFSWIGCDVDNDSLGAAYVSEDGKVYAISSRWEQSAGEDKYVSELICVEKVPADSVPHKEVITMAVSYLDYTLRPFLINFNRNSSTVRIDVKEYNEIDQLNTEIMAGNYPDIIDSNTIPIDRLAAKGLLEDLYPYIDKDPEISREDFFPNILQALENNGKLYSTISNFSIQTVVGASSVVGDAQGWTYEDLYSAMSTMPEGCTIFDRYFTRDTVLSYCLDLEGSRLVDWSTGECHFNERTFKSMLEFAKRFPAEYDWENDDYIDSYSAVAQGKQLLLNAYIYNFEDVMQYPAIFRDELNFVGFPTYDGVGHLMMLNNRYAMFSACKNKDAAWEFLRTLLTKEYQESVYNLPANIEAFDNLMQNSMRPNYRTDGDGNFILDANGNKIEDPRYTMGFGDGNYIEIYSLSEEMGQAVKDIVTSTTRINGYDSEINEIVFAESAPFFAGQKSVDDVAKLIQNKVSIYVNEQR